MARIVQVIIILFIFNIPAVMAQLVIKNTGGTALMTVTSSGRVGIATATPQAELDVVGDIRTNGFQMPTGAADGYVLTCDATGLSSWNTYERVHQLSSNLLLDGNDGSWMSPEGSEGSTFSKTISNLPVDTKYITIRLACKSDAAGGFQIRAMRQNSTDALSHGLGSCLVKDTGDSDTATITYIPVEPTGTPGQFRIYFNWSATSSSPGYNVRITHSVH